MGLNERINALPPEMQLEVADFVEYLHQKQMRQQQNASEKAIWPRPSLLDVLDSAPGKLVFASADEVDAHIRAERDAWDA